MSTNRRLSASERLEKKLGRLNFGDALRAIAEEDFDTLAECSKRLGMKPPTFHGLLTGKRIPTPELAGKIAKKLGHSPKVFIELALSDAVKRAGYKFKVKLETA
jgi:plasmid maintenance system antidote protein VapI